MPQQSEATSATITRKLQILVRPNNRREAVTDFVEPQATAHDLKNLMRRYFRINLSSCSFAFKSMLLQPDMSLTAQLVSDRCKISLFPAVHSMCE